MSEELSKSSYSQQPFTNVLLSWFLISECKTTTITYVFFIISAPSTKKFADIDYWNYLSYVIVVIVQSVSNNFLWRKQKQDINNLLSFQLLRCVRRKVKRFPSFMKFFLCCVVDSRHRLNMPSRWCLGYSSGKSQYILFIQENSLLSNYSYQNILRIAYVVWDALYVCHCNEVKHKHHIWSSIHSCCQ